VLGASPRKRMRWMWPVLAAETYAAYGFEYSRVDVATGNALVHETWTTGLKRKQILHVAALATFGNHRGQIG